jgi:NAD(P)-dependent dehydrogenase (short-subunit alcohol dehydrogenase family)
MKLTGHHIFVTGGAKGIGEAIVRDCLAEGAKVSFIDIDVSTGEKLASELGKSVKFVEASVASFAQLSKAFSEAVSTFGAGALAFGAGTSSGSILSITVNTLASV